MKRLFFFLSVFVWCESVYAENGKLDSLSLLREYFGYTAQAPWIRVTKLLVCAPLAVWLGGQGAQGRTALYTAVKKKLQPKYKVTTRLYDRIQEKTLLLCMGITTGLVASMGYNLLNEGTFFTYGT